MKSKYKVHIVQINFETANLHNYFFLTSLVLAICSLFVLTSLPILTEILGIVLQQNESQRHTMYVTTEYFVDQEKNFYFTLLHMYAAIYIEISALMGGGLLMLAYLKHVCGMFRIAR